MNGNHLTDLLLLGFTSCQTLFSFCFDAGNTVDTASMLEALFEACEAHVMISLAHTDVLFSPGPLVDSKEVIGINFDKMRTLIHAIYEWGGFCKQGARGASNFPQSRLLQNACMYRSIWLESGGRFWRKTIGHGD